MRKFLSWQALRLRPSLTFSPSPVQSYLYIFAVFPSSSGTAISGAVWICDRNLEELQGFNMTEAE